MAAAHTARRDHRLKNNVLQNELSKNLTSDLLARFCFFALWHAHAETASSPCAGRTALRTC